MTRARIVHRNRYPQPTGQPDIPTDVDPTRAPPDHQAIAQLCRHLADTIEDTTFELTAEMIPVLWELYHRSRSIIALARYLDIIERITGDLPAIEERYGDPRPTGSYTINAGTHVYVAFDAHGHALYVGVTDDLFARMASHRRGSPWWPRMARLTWEEWPDRQAALRKELVLIRRHRPAFNKAGNPDAKEGR